MHMVASWDPGLQKGKFSMLSDIASKINWTMIELHKQIINEAEEW